MKYIYTMTTQDGTQANLAMNDLAFAHNLYRFFATREYIQDNYPSLTNQQLDIVTDRMAIPAVYPNRLAAEQGHKLWCVMAATALTQVWDTATNTYLTL